MQLALSQSRTPAGDVRIYYANHMTGLGEMWKQFFKLDIWLLDILQSSQKITAWSEKTIIIDRSKRIVLGFCEKMMSVNQKKSFAIL